MGQHRQRAVNNLLTTQLSVTEELRSGVETYVDPLLSLLPPDAHQRMFAGLKQARIFCFVATVVIISLQLCAVSMVIASQVKARCISFTDSSAPVNSYVESLADIYWVHVSLII